MKGILAIIGILFSLSFIIQLFEKSVSLSAAVTIAIVLFLFISIKRDQQKLSSLSPEELSQKALKEYNEKENLRSLKQNMEREKEIRKLKSYIKSKLGMDVNPEKEEIEIDGILFRVENRPDRWLPVLIGRFHCRDCYRYGPQKIIDDISDYGYLLKEYQEHMNR